MTTPTRLEENREPSRIQFGCAVAAAAALALLLLLLVGVVYLILMGLGHTTIAAATLR